jgi:hypothetical protein
VFDETQLDEFGMDIIYHLPSPPGREDLYFINFGGPSSNINSITWDFDVTVRNDYAGLTLKPQYRAVVRSLVYFVSATICTG